MSSTEKGASEPFSLHRRFSRKRKMLLGLAAVAVVGAILASSLATSLLAAGTPARAPEGVGIQGAVTITLYGPSGQTLGVWKTHNSLTAEGTSMVAMCLEGYNIECPGAGAFDSMTAFISVAISPCTSAYGLSFVQQIQESCGIPSAATVSLSGCPGVPPDLTCTGWVATATFSPQALGCASSCTLNDVASGPTSSSSSTSYQFDDIPSANFPSPITISAGDSLAVNIQFTVS